MQKEGAVTSEYYCVIYTDKRSVTPKEYCRICADKRGLNTRRTLQNFYRLERP